uniref:Protein DOM34 homolog n=1 Tax=Blastobotrys adeninivorans TaxID=409370 RepID=A0A060SVW2_BLAAD
MKLIRKKLEKDKSGEMTLCPEEGEDMWHCFNLIAEGDELEAWSHRRIIKDGVKGSGGERKLLKLRMRVETTDFEAEDCTLRIKGRVTVDHEDVSAGTYHTFTLEVQRNFTIYKQEWDAVALEIVDNAVQPDKRAEIGAIVMEEGVAHLCLLTDSLTFLRQKVEQSIPRKKRGDNAAYEKGVKRFYDSVYSAMERNFDLDQLKVILLASPGFVARGYLDHMLSAATTNGNTSLLKQKSKFVVAHSSTGYLQGLEEALKDPSVQTQLANTRYARETAALEQFFKILNDDDMRAWYGPRHVQAAAEKGAIGTLMITDSLFRSADIPTRRKYIAMVEELRNSGREALVFSTMHPSGKELADLGGIACILLYPDPELDDIEDWDQGL